MNYDTYKLASPDEHKECKDCAGDGYIKTRLESVEVDVKIFADEFEIEKCKNCDGIGSICF